MIKSFIQPAPGSKVIKFKSTFHTKDFCYFWNIVTTLQQNHAEIFNKFEFEEKL